MAETDAEARARWGMREETPDEKRRRYTEAMAKLPSKTAADPNAKFRIGDAGQYHGAVRDERQAEAEIAAAAAAVRDKPFRAAAEALPSRDAQPRDDGAIPSQALATAGQAQSSAAQIADINQALGARYVSQRSNPRYETMRDYAEVRKHTAQNMAEAGRMEVVAAQMQQRAVAERAQADVIDFAAQNEAAKAKEKIRAEHTQAEIDTQRQIVKQHEDAVGMLMSAPDVDPDRYWADKPAAMKFAAVLGAALLGAAGRDPFRHIEGAIERDVDAQKSNLARRQSGVNARMQQLGAQQSLLGTMREAFNDERAAELAYKNARLAEAQQRMQALQMRTGQPIMHAQALQTMAQIDQTMADNLVQIKELELANPRRFTRVSAAVTGPEREALEQERKYLYEQRGKADEGTIDIVKESAKTRGGAVAEEDKDLQRRVEKYGEAVGKVEPAIAALEDYKQELQSHGSAALEWGSDQPVTAARLAATTALVSEMYGAANPVQFDQVQDMISSISADKAVQLVDAHLRKLNASHAAARASYGDDAAASYRAVTRQGLGSRRARTMGDAEDPVEADK